MAGISNFIEAVNVIKAIPFEATRVGFVEHLRWA
jgi:hypothetical protein